MIIQSGSVTRKFPVLLYWQTVLSPVVLLVNQLSFKSTRKEYWWWLMTVYQLSVMTHWLLMTSSIIDQAYYSPWYPSSHLLFWWWWRCSFICCCWYIPVLLLSVSDRWLDCPHLHLFRWDPDLLLLFIVSICWWSGLFGGIVVDIVVVDGILMLMIFGIVPSVLTYCPLLTIIDDCWFDVIDIQLFPVFIDPIHCCCWYIDSLYSDGNLVMTVVTFCDSHLIVTN